MASSAPRRWYHTVELPDGSVTPGWFDLRPYVGRYGIPDDLDGIWVDYDDWPYNVRPSNTEPLPRLTRESLVSREDMERRRDDVLALIRS